jgi:hypothetical protein
MTNITNNTTITADYPDRASATVLFYLESNPGISGLELVTLDKYTMTLDGNGAGSIDLPTPDGTGDEAWTWTVQWPDGQLYRITVAYDAAAQSLATLVASYVATVDPDELATLLATRIPLISPAVAGNLVVQSAGGELEDGGISVGTATTGAAFGDSSVTTTGGAMGSGAATESGGAIGAAAESVTGGAVGADAITTTGGAVGTSANATTGGAVGTGARATSGFSGGSGAVGTADNIQLGTGENNTASTLQVYGNQLLDASGNIPAGRMTANLGTAAVLDAGTTGADLVEAETVDDARDVLGLAALDLPGYYSDHRQFVYSAADVVSGGNVTRGASNVVLLQSTATAGGRVRAYVNSTGLLLNETGRFVSWDKRITFGVTVQRLTTSATGYCNVFFGRESSEAFGSFAGNFVGFGTLNGRIVALYAARASVLTTIAVSSALITSSPRATVHIASDNGTVNWYFNGVLLGSTTAGPNLTEAAGTISADISNGGTATNEYWILSSWSQG